MEAKLIRESKNRSIKPKKVSERAVFNSSAKQTRKKRPTERISKEFKKGKQTFYEVVEHLGDGMEVSYIVSKLDLASKMNPSEHDAIMDNWMYRKQRGKK